MTCGSSSQVGGCTVIGSSQPSPIGSESPLAGGGGAGSAGSGAEGGTRGATGGGGGTAGFSCGLFKMHEEGEVGREERKFQTVQFEPKRVWMLLAASWVLGQPILVGKMWEVQMQSGLVHPKGWYPMRRAWTKTGQGRRYPTQEGPGCDLGRRESRGGCHLTSRICQVGLGRKSPRRVACLRNPGRVRRFYRDGRGVKRGR